MQGTCPNAGCGAVYTLAPQNVGRQFACRQCGVMLRVEQDGLHLATENAAASPATPAAAASAPAASRASSAKAFAKGPLAHMQANLFDWLFGAGAVIVIIFTFFPVLDKLHSLRYHADVRAAEIKFTRYDRESTKSPDETVRKNREKELEGLRDKAEDQDEGSKYAAWWYGWGTLIGFLLLAVAAIAWMGPNQTKTHRVVAAVVMCTQLLLVFITYIVMAGIMSHM